MKLISTTKELTIAAGFGAAFFVIAFIVGTPINIALGPAASGIIIPTIWAVMATITAKLLQRFGAITVFSTVYGILAIPTIQLGVPGLHKIFIGFIVGLLYDVLMALILVIHKKGNAAYIITATLYTVGQLFIVVGVFAFIGLPIPLQDLWAKTGLLTAAIIGIAWLALQGLIGSMIGLWVFDKKISKLKVVRQLQS